MIIGQQRRTQPILELQPKIIDVVDMSDGMEAHNIMSSIFSNVTMPDFPASITYEDIWIFLQYKYGEHYLLPDVTDYEHTFVDTDIYCPKISQLNWYMKSLFTTNLPKYNRLLESLNKKYDVLAPYHIEEEHSLGEANAKLNSHSDTHEDINKESAMDDTTLVQKTSTYYPSYTDYVEGAHDRSVTFKGNSFESQMDSISHKKDSREGNIGNHSYAELIEKEIKLARYNLFDIISQDIVDVIAYKIFATSC